jgi:signal recognition particle receptor subunit beta
LEKVNKILCLVKKKTNKKAHIQTLEKKKKEEITTKRSRQREIIKIGVGINKIDLKTIQRISQTMSWFYEKINKIDKSLSN